MEEVAEKHSHSFICSGIIQSVFCNISPPFFVILEGGNGKIIKEKKGDVCMKRKFKILGLSMVVAAILALAIVGTVGAANNDPGTGSQTQNQGVECRCGECPCGDCDPINNSYQHGYSYNHNYSYDYGYSYSSPGPHGSQNGK